MRNSDVSVSTCGAKNVPLEKEHILPKAKGGTNRVSNLTVSCRECNIEKGNQHPDEIDGNFGKRVQSALRAAKKPPQRCPSCQHYPLENRRNFESDRVAGHLRHPVVKRNGIGNKQDCRKRITTTRHVLPVSPIPQFRQLVLAIHAVGYGHRRNLGDYQTKQKAPGFKSPYTRIEHAGGFQKLDTVEMMVKKGKVVGYLNTFDKTADNKNPKSYGSRRIGTGTVEFLGTLRNYDGLSNDADGYAYEIIEIEHKVV